MRGVAISLDLSLSAIVLPVTIGNMIGVTFGNSSLCRCEESCSLFASLSSGLCRCLV